MQIGVRHRFIFVANTKAASTSLEHALAPHAEIQRTGTPERKHVPLRRAVKIYDFLFGQPGMGPGTFFKFAVMRDPLDWISSWYRYRTGNKVEATLPKDLSFEDFWARNDWNISRPDGSPNLQRDLLCRWNGDPFVDYVLRYETLDADFAGICEALGLEVTLPRLNVSAIPASEAVIPAALEDQVRAHYQLDYALLDAVEEINARGMDSLKRTRAFTRDGPV